MTHPRSPWARKYSIEQSISYSVVPPLSAEKELPRVDISKFLSELRAAKEILPAKEPTPQPPLVRPRCAVWIVHGMGQQLPFETLDGLAEGIMSVAEPLPGHADFEPRFRSVQIGSQTLQRVEIGISWQGREADLHLYEAYWAPITEGQVKLKDVVGFLFDGCFRGIWNSFHVFLRAMFGVEEDFKIPGRAAVEIVATLLTLLALTILNGIIVASGASKYGLTGAKLPHLRDHWVSFSAIASSLSSVAIAFAGVLFLDELSRPMSNSPFLYDLFHRHRRLFARLARSIKRLITCTTWIGFALTLIAVIVGAFVIGAFAVLALPTVSAGEPLFPQLQLLSTVIVLAVLLIIMAAIAVRGAFRSRGIDVRQTPIYFPLLFLSLAIFGCAFFGPIFLASVHFGSSPQSYPVLGSLSRPVWVWPFLLLLSYVVRQLMVQYVGDVVAYVSSNKLDRFYRIRQEIKKVALDSAAAVYLAQENGQFLYDKVAIVGHSLGSVIAYDTLNALLNADVCSATPLDIAERTGLFETFGSPLDKIAFFFNIQGKSAFYIREQLAETVQPLIQDYVRFRQFPWINVYSPQDFISGKVQLYDLRPENKSAAMCRLIRDHHVRHFTDPGGIVPIVAHVDYWRNSRVWQLLVSRITR